MLRNLAPLLPEIWGTLPRQRALTSWKEVCLPSPAWVPGLCPPPPSPGSNYQASVCALRVQRAGPARPRRPRPRPARPAGGVRNPGCGHGEHESACPGQLAPPPAPAPGTAAVGRAPRPACRVRAGATHGGRLRGGGRGGQGARRGAGCVALGSALLLALPAPSGRPPRRGGAEGRSGQPRPRRRLEARPVTQAGARGAPC